MYEYANDRQLVRRVGILKVPVDILTIGPLLKKCLVVCLVQIVGPLDLGLSLVLAPRIPLSCK